MVQSQRHNLFGLLAKLIDRHAENSGHGGNLLFQSLPGHDKKRINELLGRQAGFADQRTQLGIAPESTGTIIWKDHLHFLQEKEFKVLK